MPVPVINQYTGIDLVGDSRTSGFLPIRLRHSKKVLRNLREDSGTGPDGLPARIFRRCADVLALPIIVLIRLIIALGIWPQDWKLHWLYPLYKRKAKSSVNNYRGIHLTTQLSKVAERILCIPLLPYLDAVGAYGKRQFAYRNHHGYRDALACMVFSWIWALGLGKRVALYCSDVSGAFDRVNASRLIQKLRAAGVHDLLLEVLKPRFALMGISLINFLYPTWYSKARSLVPRCGIVFSQMQAEQFPNMVSPILHSPTI